jgi:hypothetical protein
MTFPGPGDWREPDPGLLNQLADHGASAAHIPVLSAGTATNARKTYVAVRAALRMLLANGLITAVPAEDWPEYLFIDPPSQRGKRT